MILILGLLLSWWGTSSNFINCDPRYQPVWTKLLLSVRGGKVGEAVLCPANFAHSFHPPLGLSVFMVQALQKNLSVLHCLFDP
jgi:hypothetical protein